MSRAHRQRVGYCIFVQPAMWSCFYTIDCLKSPEWACYDSCSSMTESTDYSLQYSTACIPLKMAQILPDCNFYTGNSNNLWLTEIRNTNPFDTITLKSPLDNVYLKPNLNASNGLIPMKHANHGKEYHLAMWLFRQFTAH